MLIKKEMWDFLTEGTNRQGPFEPITELIRQTAQDVITLLIVVFIACVVIKKFFKR